jgi:hypothetical protein
MFGERWYGWWEWYGVAMIFWLLAVSALFTFYGWVEYTVWKGPWFSKTTSLPVPLPPGRRRQRVGALAAGALLVSVLALVLHPDLPFLTSSTSHRDSASSSRTPDVLSSPPLATSKPATPTLQELERSNALSTAATVLSVWVNIAHETWQELLPPDKNSLCVAGKDIRAAMMAHHNTRAALSSTERAIYDITAYPGRCP